MLKEKHIFQRILLADIDKYEVRNELDQAN